MAYIRNKTIFAFVNMFDWEQGHPEKWIILNYYCYHFTGFRYNIFVVIRIYLFIRMLTRVLSF